MHSLESNSSVPTFILKLWKLVSEEASSNLICWNRNGRSFVIKDQSRFAKEILPLYFKHSNMASFIRQLNMYGFRKVSNIENGGLKSDGDEVEFFHHHFSLDHEDQLPYIKRKMSNNKSITSIVKVDEFHDILSDVESIRGRQDSVDTLLNNLKQENEALWREVALLRQKHIKQQQIVEKLLQFLVSIVRNRVVGGIKRKAPLLIDSDITNNRKVIKNNKDNSNALCLASSSGINGPIIHDITDLLEDQHLIDNEALISNLQLPSAETRSHKSPPSRENESLISNDTDAKKSSIQEDSLISSIPSTLIDIELNQNHSSPLNNEQSFSANSSILNTPKIIYDSTTSNENDLVDNNNLNNFSTDLVLSSKPKSSIPSNLPKLTSENFNEHVEGIDAELNWLQDQFYDGNLNIDPTTILGLFASDNNLLLPESIEASSSETIPKAIMDNPNTKMIKIEENNDNDFFEGLDLNNIGHDTKDILSQFVSEIDPNTFN